MKKLLCDVIFLFATLRLVWRNRHDQYSVVHAVEESVFIAWLVKRCWGIPYIYDMDSSMSLQITEKWRWCKPLAPIMNFLEGIAVRGSVAVAPVCDALSTIAAKHGSPHTVMLRDVSLLPASTEHTHERNCILDISLDSEQPVILYVGNLEFYQGIDLLLESFTLLQNHSTRPHLVIIGGDSDLIAAYRTRARDLGCSSAVSFLGPRPVAKLNEYLAAADILVSPRIAGNNTPMKIYSYLHSGKALVATDLPTHRQVLDEEVAVLVPCEPNGFAQGIQTLLEAPTLRHTIGHCAHNRAERLYTLSAFETQLSVLYDEVHSRVQAHGGHGIVVQEEA